MSQAKSLTAIADCRFIEPLSPGSSRAGARPFDRLRVMRLRECLSVFETDSDPLPEGIR
jgi:hypothetical protein